MDVGIVYAQESVVEPFPNGLVPRFAGVVVYPVKFDVTVPYLVRVGNLAL